MVFVKIDKINYSTFHLNPDAKGTPETSLLSDTTHTFYNNYVNMSTSIEGNSSSKGNIRSAVQNIFPYLVKPDI